MSIAKKHLFLRTTLCVSIATLCVSCVSVFWEEPSVSAEPDVQALESLGKHVFFDEISVPDGQSCASCHAPEAGWTSPDSQINELAVVVPGAKSPRSGNRKPPTVAYTSSAKNFGVSQFARNPTGCEEEHYGFLCAGGLFWDGRATGENVGKEVFAGTSDELKNAYERFLGPLADQALGPFANDVEQNVPDGEDNGMPGAEFVCRHVANSDYAKLYEQAWKEPIDCETTGVDISFKRIGVALSAWQQSDEVNSYSSKRDFAVMHDDDDTPGHSPYKHLTDLENLGNDLFFGLKTKLNPQGKSAMCVDCHNSEARDSVGNELHQQFTDNAFNHIGLPPNYEASNFNPNRPDTGLAEHTSATPLTSGHAGHFRTPTVRNVDKRINEGFVKAYMHNGYFKNLEDIVHYYNTSLTKVDPLKCPPGTTAKQARERDCWPEPEINSPNQASNDELKLMGNLGLTEKEEAALVAFLKALTDTQTVTPPKLVSRD
ncbi:methylamine utilization protein [Pseudoalteromonas sp. JBTF-M23]|uniref:Methylamine utilization protein n=1 Tax=Pseudoalteromonas caenipelagi TaxID=2726988 RepID=A0A849VES0_9GAMM|nr:cytochrome c peroxidase [Pseudoalteromonas caenipelagi]NOU51268.1 methylamine utilization protein [Pseudoalteromonas caenipelagi]